MVNRHRLPVFIRHPAFSKPLLELPRFRLFLQFPVDFCPRVEYTMDEAVLNRAAGELDPGPVEQATNLGLFSKEKSAFRLSKTFSAAFFVLQNAFPSSETNKKLAKPGMLKPSWV
ncbi:MAG: hypothetical protein SOX25_11375 [Eubacteriales bacterium]|nr:hypothetical protein [Eubacteriales bacterium]